MEFLSKLKDILTTYCYSTDIPLSVIDVAGNEVVSIGNSIGFCRFFYELTGDLCPCSQTHLYSSKQAASMGDAYIFSCPAGLIHFTVPLFQKGTFKGAVLAGPVLIQFPDSLMTDDILQKFNLPVELRGKINSYLRAVQVIEPSRITHLSKLLFIVVLSLMGDERNILYERNEKSKQQAVLSETIQSIKNENEDKFYPYESEKELLMKVRNGDIIGAKNILNDLLGHMLFFSGGNLEIIKSHTLELCTLLSRAAMEGNADVNKTFDKDNNFIKEISKLKDIESLTFWLINILDKFTKNTFPITDTKNASIIQKAVSFINENYKDNLTLDMVADLVHLNSSYFSSVFKKEMRMNFSGYLNKVRIENSKLLLRDTESSISDIAQEVGFEDQSYFTKVFKSLTQMTPKEYQNNLFI